MGPRSYGKLKKSCNGSINVFLMCRVSDKQLEGLASSFSSLDAWVIPHQSYKWARWSFSECTPHTKHLLVMLQPVVFPNSEKQLAPKATDALFVILSWAHGHVCGSPGCLPHTFLPALTFSRGQWNVNSQYFQKPYCSLALLRNAFMTMFVRPIGYKIFHTVWNKPWTETGRQQGHYPGPGLVFAKGRKLEIGFLQIIVTKRVKYQCFSFTTFSLHFYLFTLFESLRCSFQKWISENSNNKSNPWKRQPNSFLCL